MSCIVCGTTLTEDSPGRVHGEERYCDSCYDELGLAKLDETGPPKRPKRRTQPEPDLTTTPPPALHADNGSAAACFALGILFFAIGVYFLLLAPSDSEIGTVAVANLHRLTIGETSAIVGAIFLAAGIRPR